MEVPLKKKVKERRSYYIISNIYALGIYGTGNYSGTGTYFQGKTESGTQLISEENLGGRKIPLFVLFYSVFRFH